MVKAVICVLQNQDGCALFVKRSKQLEFMPGVWALPSGHVRENETKEETVLRKLASELGISVRIVKLLHKYTEREDDRGDKVEKFIYLVKPTSILSDIKVNLIDADGAVFLTFKEFFSKFSDEEYGHVLRILRNKYQSLGLK